MLDKDIWEKPVSHGEILKRIWKHLDLGTLDRHHPFHTPVFATVEDCQPRLRTVVLRRFWRKPPALAFHAHIESPKVFQIRANPSVSWLLYHPDEKLQLRIRSRATVHADGDLHEEQWLATELISRRCYIGDPPSRESRRPTSGLPEELLGRKPTREESEEGKKNFVVVVTTIDEIDCMELAVRGHRRSRFRWNGAGDLETTWLTP